MNLTTAIVLILGWCAISVPLGLACGHLIREANAQQSWARRDYNDGLTALIAQHARDRAESDRRLDLALVAAADERKLFVSTVVAMTTQQQARNLNGLMRATQAIGPIAPGPDEMAEHLERLLEEHASPLPPGVSPVGAES